ncbi:MAG TPA: FtsX-like permease family protein, partial [Paenarthrobacter sp.]|nr:FtsX-like permease family protein [Paenarthrobacter sp.]
QPTRTLPITATGIGAEVDSTGKALDITSGTGLGDYTAAEAKAIVGTTLAEKNNLTVGSTFTIQDKTFTVAGLFDAGTTFGNNAVYVTLPEAQTLAATPDELSTMIVTVNSMENVDSTKTALQSALGTDKADVTQGQRNLQTAVNSLDSVKNISLVAFIAALATAGLIILLIMVMLVRERRREIGVLKAIGARNRTIGLQFVLESLVLVALGSVVGAAIASFASGGIASALISSNSSTTAAPTQRGGGLAGAVPNGSIPGGGGGFGGQGGPFGGASQLLTSVTASASPGVIAAGIAAVFAVAIIGALVPALLTARIRPIEVLRGE